MHQHIHVVIHSDPEVYEIKFKNNSDAAVAEYADAILEKGREFLEQKRTAPIYILIDITQSGLYSLQFAIQYIRRNTEQLSDVPNAYFAYLTDSPSERILIQQFSFFQNTRSRDSRKVFASHAREEAIAWLISNTES